MQYKPNSYQFYTQILYIYYSIVVLGDCGRLLFPVMERSIEPNFFFKSLFSNFNCLYVKKLLMRCVHISSKPNVYLIFIVSLLGG